MLLSVPRPDVLVSAERPPPPPALARLVAVEADAAGPEIFAAAGGEEIAEAEAVIRKRDRAVRIAFAGRDRIAHSGDEKLAPLDLAAGPARRASRRRKLDRDRGRLAVARAQVHVLAAIGRQGLGRAFAIVERPRTGRVGRDLARKPDRHRMVDRSEIRFAHPVALAGLQDAAGAVDAQPGHHVA